MNNDLAAHLPAGADRVNAVENVSFAVAPGEIVCVVGESDSGKSVTAHAIMRLLPPNQLTVAGGRALLDGNDLLTKSPAEMRRIRGDRISMIFQEPMTALNQVMRVGDQIAEVLDIHTKLNERERRARARGDARGAPARARAHHRRLSAPVVRRAAPAHLHRARSRWIRKF
ncbi:ABC transporter ATP-binding protein [Bradyrhizobium lablabi]|nr:ATP-binding cassette domain-containing protein [Bradyrhizobium lablabi]MBR0694271.1 ABC transporter ATP-binding protein [Bradyrhizobium lablabi]